MRSTSLREPCGVSLGMEEEAAGSGKIGHCGIVGGSVLET